jgi:hypothetical protein
VDEYEREGLLTPNTFWNELQIAKAVYPERVKAEVATYAPSYRLEEVLALMQRSELAGDLRSLLRENSHLKAGIVQMGFFRPYLDPMLTRRNKIIIRK